MYKRQYITTSFPYIGSQIKSRFIYELILADIYNRFMELKGIKTRFISGIDTTSQNLPKKYNYDIERTRNSIINIKEEYSSLYKALQIKLDESYNTDDFSHGINAQKIWSKIESSNISKNIYQNYYCFDCDEYYSKSSCPIHNSELKIKKEENYFLDISNYKSQISTYFENENVLIPQSILKELTNTIKNFPNNYSISRLRGSGQKEWGIQVPNDKSQTIYTWFDALTGYLNAAKENTESVKYNFWEVNTNKVHFISKKHLTFHGLIWSVILLSAGLPLPDKIVVHGNIILPENLRFNNRFWENLRTNDSYSIRLYFTQLGSPFKDHKFDNEELKKNSQKELDNKIINLYSRVHKLCLLYNVPFSKLTSKKISIPQEFEDHMNSMRFDLALEFLMNQIKEYNAQITQFEFWKEQSISNNKNRIQDLLFDVSNTLKLFSPFLPDFDNKIYNQFQYDKFNFEKE